MLFNSFDFLVFFPIVCLIYYVIPHRVRYLFLLAASYFFYMCWNPKYIVLLLFSTVVTWLGGILLDKAEKKEDSQKKQKQKKGILASVIILNLMILFGFKYFDFAVESINKILSFLHISTMNVAFDVVLPVGISFYTFQALGYLIDVYRGDIYCEKNFFKYALFVSFFPQLVAGPIERSKNLLKEISIKHEFNVREVQSGLILMLFGLFQKMVISDNAAIIVDQIYNNYSSYGSLELILATVLFAFQIYCDFGGYSNIAIGAARVMGFHLMENFDTPYLANTVSDFWRRWHISLTSWFRDYLYIPLGGNRKGKWRKYANILMVFLTSGLWHGASWHFVVWGGLNGVYQIVGDLTKKIRRKLCDLLKINVDCFSHQLLKVITTFVFVDISWIFFRVESVSQACSIMVRILDGILSKNLIQQDLYKQIMSEKQFHMLLIVLFILLITDIMKYLKVDLIKELCAQGLWFRYLIYLLLIFSVLLFGVYGPGYDAGQFIYFQF